MDGLYTYEGGVVVDVFTRRVSAESASGVLVSDPTTAAPLTMYDVTGSPISSLPVSEVGTFSPFRADVKTAYLSFGSGIFLIVKSIEYQDAGANAADAKVAALAAATAALDAADDASAAAAAAAAAATGATAPAAAAIDNRLGGTSSGLLETAGDVVASKISKALGTSTSLLADMTAGEIVKKWVSVGFLDTLGRIRQDGLVRVDDKPSAYSGSFTGTPAQVKTRFDASIEAARQEGAILTARQGQVECEDIKLTDGVIFMPAARSRSRFTLAIPTSSGGTRKAAFVIKRPSGSTGLDGSGNPIPIISVVGAGAGLDGVMVDGANKAGTGILVSGFETELQRVSALNVRGYGYDLQRANNGRWRDLYCDDCGTGRTVGVSGYAGRGLCCVRWWSKHLTFPDGTADNGTTNSNAIFGLTIERPKNIWLEVGFGTDPNEFWSEYAVIYGLHCESSFLDGGNQDPGMLIGNVDGFDAYPTILYAGSASPDSSVIRHVEQGSRPRADGKAKVRLFGGQVLGPDPAEIGVPQAAPLVDLVSGNGFSAHGTAFTRWSSAVGAIRAGAAYGRDVFIDAPSREMSKLAATPTAPVFVDQRTVAGKDTQFGEQSEARERLSVPSRYANRVAAVRSQGALVLVLDDGHPSHFTVAKPILDAAGGRATIAVTPQYSYNSNGMNSGNTAQISMTWAQIKALYDAGWEVANHSKTHTDMTTFTAAQRLTEWDDSDATIRTNMGVIPTSWVYPYDGCSLATDTEAWDRYPRIFGGSNLPYLRPRGDTTLGSRIGRLAWSSSGTKANQPQALALLRQAAASGSILTLYTHAVDGTSATNGVTTAEFTELVQLAQTLGMSIITAREAFPDPILAPDLGFASGGLQQWEIVPVVGFSGNVNANNTVSVVTDTPPQGFKVYKSLKISSTDGVTYPGVITRSGIPIFGADEITVSCRARQQKTSGTWGGYIGVRQFDAYGATISDTNSTQMTATGTTAWQQLSVAFTPAANAVSYKIFAIQRQIVGDTYFTHFHHGPTRLGVLG